ncbi:FAD-binding FR-type domain-containing protein [Fusarium sp. Ph1]|nr:FAD-binding FR-type domain-containing protein [Fusarium sp. Ph1]
MSTNRTTHLERTAQEPRDESLLPVKLSKIEQVNEGIRSFRLLLPRPVKFSAGQWLDTYVPGLDKPGGFTITSRPSDASSADEPYFDLAVQASPENPPAAWLWQPPSEIIGSTLQVRVGGSYVFPPQDVPMGGIRRVVFAAGGVGINPLVSMMGHIADGGYDVDVRVLYASKVPKGGLKEVIFLERIAGWFAHGKLKGELKAFATGGANKEVENARFEVLTRRFGVEDIREAVGDRTDEGLVYVCGPQGMTDELVEGLTGEGGLDKRRVLVEKWW